MELRSNNLKQYRISDIEIGLKSKEDGRIYRQAERYASPGGKPYQAEISLDDEFLLSMQKENPHLSLDECEYIWTGYEFCKKLLDFDGFMLHSSGIAYENKAYLFSAASGTGKSTHTEIWQKVFGEDNAVIINDDKPAVRMVDGKFYAYGTPWSGKSDKNLNIKVPLQGICFIERSKNNHIERITSKEALLLIFNQTVRPPELDIMDKLIVILDSLLKTVPVYKLGCNMEDEAAIVSYNGMKDGKV